MTRRYIKPFEVFFKSEAASGMIILLLTAIALIIANSSLSENYEKVLHLNLTIGWGKISLTKSLLHWINDGLMAIFFFLIGMEIKRELTIGELNSYRKAILPVGAAIGGMIIPAFLYFLFNQGKPSINGWGVPMATDIAFALGILSLLGSKKVPKGIRVFLAALAIIDDLGAIVVIAIFYTEKIAITPIVIALVVLSLLFLASKLRKQFVSLYLLFGIILWLAVLKSGIHATIAGVLLGMIIPASSSSKDNNSILNKLEHALQPWIAFGVIPLFVLANAGVTIDFSKLNEVMNSPVGLGIIIGLFIGKPIGIFGTIYLMKRLGMAKLPSNVTMKQLFGVSVLGGIGFTMSVFIATLAFTNPMLLVAAKISIIFASIFSAIAGVLILSLQGEKRKINREDPV